MVVSQKKFNFLKFCPTCYSLHIFSLLSFTFTFYKLKIEIKYWLFFITNKIVL